MKKETTNTNPRIHKALVDAVIYALTEVFIKDRKADKVLAEVLRSNKKWGSRDRAFIAESTYDIVRWWRLLHFISDSHIDTPSSALQIKKIVGVWLVLKGADVSAFPEYGKLNKKLLDSKYAEAKHIRKAFHSIPDWLDNLGVQELGDDTGEEELIAMNIQAPVTLRVNTLKNSKQELMNLLLKEGIETDEVKNMASAINLRKRQNIFISNAFKEGRFEVQDGGSQLIGAFLNVEPGMRVIDACAGAGG